MRKQIITAAVSIVVGITAFSQSTGAVKRTWVFSSTRQYGTVPVDPESGQPVVRKPTTNFIIYIETAEPLTDWKLTGTSRQNYNITSAAAVNGPVDVGEHAATRKSIVVKPGKGSKLWQLIVSPLTTNESGKKTIPTAFTLTAKSQAKTVAIKTVKSVPLLQYDAQ